ncbi:glycine zipper 2TM domain-containing protein [Hymenobacter koreensis]|uniref:Glycine zipper 2TM domain-containing protein n=2 Tax=Hymenobacter koreensis TaxID=1084523 RepID=A0ABP8JLL7_9BACT
MRSMTAPALLSSALRAKPSGRLAQSALSWMQSKTASRGLKLMAGAEMVSDKLPGMPDRTVPPVLLGRILSGALVGAVLYKTGRGSLFTGAAVGGLGAVAGTFAALRLRKLASERTSLQEPWPGFVEDALTVATGKAVLSGYKPKR